MKHQDQHNGYIKKILLSTCVYYTIVTFFVLFLYWIINADLSRGLNPISLILFLPFSLAFSFANHLFRHGKMNKAGKVLLHYLLTMGGIFLFLFLPNKSGGQSPAGAFILFLVLSIIYAVIVGIILFLQGRMQKLGRDTSAYVSVYKKDEK